MAMGVGYKRISVGYGRVEVVFVDETIRMRGIAVVVMMIVIGIEQDVQVVADG
jgi:hypothetical protein